MEQKQIDCINDYLKNSKSIQVIVTDTMVKEACNKCCSFYAEFVDFPGIKADVIIGWKSPGHWKPIYTKFKNIKVGDIIEVSNDGYSKWQLLGPFYNCVKLNTNTITLVSKSENTLITSMIKPVDGEINGVTIDCYYWYTIVHIVENTKVDNVSQLLSDVKNLHDKCGMSLSEIEQEYVTEEE